MYRPIQIPHVLSKEYAKYISHKEIELATIENFAIHGFEAYSRTDKPLVLKETILIQGTIDIGFDLDNKWVGFGNVSETDFNFTWQLPFRNFGIRLKPGAFYQLTGIPATSIMDDFISLSTIDEGFDEDAFFQLTFDEGKAFLINYIERLCKDKEPDKYTTLFDDLAKVPSLSTTELYEIVGLSSRQCQRVFTKHFGFSPKMALTILRFQRCLYLLTSANLNAGQVMEELDYYDQAHFINDFKGNIGLTPRELVRLYSLC
jgi:AraC-like DNA-binding protein